MKQTKIDWCDSTINPVVGCPNNCEYCYARKLNARFGFISDWSKPQFFPERLKEFESKKPKSIFIDSMSDIGTWKEEWLEETVKAISKNTQHHYIALTKTDVNVLVDKLIEADLPQEAIVWLGKTVTTQKQADMSLEQITDFLSIEPILEELDFSQTACSTRAVIIGAETGNRKGRVIPKREWIERIVSDCDAVGVKVFMKESLRTLMGEDFRQDKLMWMR